MKADMTEQADTQVKTETDGGRLELAAAIYELYKLGLIVEEIDERGTPRFRPTENQL